MDTTTLGRTKVRVTRLSYGTAGIGNLYQPVDEETALGAVEAAWAEGIRAFDTAPHYGLGLAERRVGRFLRGQPRESFTVSTKVGRILEPAARPEGDDLAAGGFAVPATHVRRWDFSADGINRSLAESLERLGLDRVDIAYLHDPEDHAEQALTEAYPALEKLRAQGVIGAIGIGIKQSALPARFVRETDIDAVLLAGRYTLLEQSALDDLLPVAAERGVSIVIGGVFNSGVLADPRSDSAYEYGAVPMDVLDRALRMKAVCEENGVSLRAAALQFPFGHPAVSSVLIGARTANEVHDAVEQAGRRVPAVVWERLRAAGLLAQHVPVPDGKRAAA